jgi:hypothetical protein
MLELFIAELRRYRTAAVLFATAGFIIEFLMFRSSLFLEAPFYVQLEAVFASTMSGMALAIFQFGSYRKPARWLWLLHRPLPRVITFMALHLAAAALIVLAVGAPLELALLATKAEHARVVDTRHFLDAMHLTLFAILGWQTASYAMLARHRGASLVLMMPVILVSLYFASAFVLFIPALLCLLVMGCALYTVFRPERHSSAKLQPLSVALAAIPIMFCTYFVMVWGTTILFTIGHSASGMATPLKRTPGGVIEAMMASAENGLIIGELTRSADPRARAWSLQIPPQSERILGANMRNHPVRHAASNAGYSAFVTGRTAWTFSHDSLHFIARDNRFGSVLGGKLGPHGTGDATPFAQPAVSIDASKTESFMYTRQSLWLVDHKTMATLPLVTFGGDEVIASLPEVDVEDGSMRIITNRRFVEYAWPLVNGELNERYSISLPGQLLDLGRVAVAKVNDGTLVTLLFGQLQEYGLTESPIATYIVQDGKVTTVHQRTLSLDAGFLYTQHFYWMSPTLCALFEVPRMLIDTGRVLDAGLTTDTMKLSIKRPLSAHALALTLLLASVAIAWIRLRRERSSPLYRAMWMLACLALGLPALFALLTLQAKQSSKQKANTATALQAA